MESYAKFFVQGKRNTKIEFKSLTIIVSTKNRRKLISKTNKEGKVLNKNQRHKIYKSISKQLDKIRKDNIVVNLSNRKLSLAEIATLNKGLNFCITNDNKNCINKNIDIDIKRFNRTLQIKFMFEGSNEIEKFTGNPSWIPPSSKCSPAIEGYTDHLREEIKKLISANKVKHNISRKERDALKSLREDKNILIQKADKGGSIVVLNTIDYKNKITQMLNDPITYTVMMGDVDLNKAKSEIDKLVINLYANEYISKKQKKN